MIEEPQIFLHLLHGGHAAEHDRRIGQASGEPKRPGSRTRLRISAAEQGYDIRMGRGERTAAHRLHDDAGNPTLSHHFILLPGALGGFPIVIIDLQLNEIPVPCMQDFV